MDEPTSGEVEESWPDRVRYLMEAYGENSREKTAVLFGVSTEQVRLYLNGAEPRMTQLAELIKSRPEISARWLLSGKGPRMEVKSEIEAYRQGLADATDPFVQAIESVRKVRERAALTMPKWAYPPLAPRRAKREEAANEGC